MKQAKVLVLDGWPGNHLGVTLREILASSQCLDIELRYESAELGATCFWDGAVSRISTGFNPDTAFLVLAAGLGKQAAEVLHSLLRASGAMPIVVVAEAAKPDEILEFLKSGAADFLTAPLKAVDVLPRVWRLLDHARQADPLTQKLKEKLGLRQFIGESPSFIAEIKKIPLIARCDASVLIAGETGTGKELCARAIHYLGARASRAFVPVNCGAIPLDLVENELFGHERGAFTGASTAQPGLIHEADGGTLFLDEIDCMPAFAQVKLLRFLQDKEYRPLGSTKIRRADVRVLAATNLELEAAVKTGKLRQDLYYRLNTISLRLPPMRERRDDIPLLARHFVAKAAARLDAPAKDISAGAVQRLLLHDWPGNLRELEHVVERAVVLSEHAMLRTADIELPRMQNAARLDSFQEAKAKVITQFEKNYIQGLLAAHQGNITHAAQAARKNRRAFWQLIHKHRIDASSFKPARA